MQLTAQDKKVLKLYGEGKTHQQIADELHIRFEAVAARIYGLHKRLNAPTRRELMQAAQSLAN